jgi:formate hydrogenlyase subunit 3/multisubunit Na+/H+ antiporter MnhD subunit
MMQHNLKRLLSFHAVSQVGYMVLGIGTGTAVGIVGGLFHMLNNAIYKSGLFLMSGTVGRAAGSDEIEDMGGLARRLPVTFICGAIAAAAISGVPPFNGFVSKWLVYQGTLQVANHGLAVALVTVAVFGSALTLASFVKVMYSAFLSPAPRPIDASKPRPRESVLMVAPMIVLAAACIFLGLFPNAAVSGVLLPGISGAELHGELPSARWRAPVATTDLGVWSPKQATGLILIGLLLGMILVWVATGGGKVRVVRPFLGGEVAAPGEDRWRIPGTHFYETISRLPLVGPLLAAGEAGAMDPYRWSGQHGGTFVRLLSRQHTGLLSLYAAWALLGMVATLLYLLLTVGA